MADAPLEKIDIMVPAHGKLDLTIQCIESIYQNTKHPFHLIVVDDSEASKPYPPSTPMPVAAKPVEAWDSTQSYMEKFLRWHDNVTYFRANKPFTCGNQFFNIAIKSMQTKYLATVMNSVRVGPNWDVRAVQLMNEDPKVGVIGFKSLFPDGTIECAGIALHEGYLPIDIGRDMPGDFLTEIYEVMAIQWAFALLRKEAVDGKLDEVTFNGFKGWDDIDNCLVVRKNGWKIMYCGFGVGIHLPRVTRGDSTVDGYLKNRENGHAFYKRWGLWNNYMGSKKMDIAERLPENMRLDLKAVWTEFQMLEQLLNSRKFVLQHLTREALKVLGVSPELYVLGLDPVRDIWELKLKVDIEPKTEVKTTIDQLTLSKDMPPPAIVVPKDNGKGDAKSVEDSLKAREETISKTLTKAMQERNEAIVKIQKDYEDKTRNIDPANTSFHLTEVK